MMTRKLKLAVSQSHTLASTGETLDALQKTVLQAANSGVDLILFPVIIPTALIEIVEAYLGGYPRTCTFGSSVGARDPVGREQFLQYFHAAVDLGDTPLGAGDDWVDRKLPIAKDAEYRGDGTRERLEQIARESGVFIVTGLVEKAAGSLYCAVLYICPRLGVLGKRRKVMPTGTERLVWAQGSTATLRAVTTTIRGVRLTLASAICWENYMPLLRHSLYSQNVNLYLAPTADARDTWLPLMRTVGIESRAFVLSSNQCIRRKHLPAWILSTNSSTTTSQPNDATINKVPIRRRSSVTVTKEHHEIVWPAPVDSAIPEDESVAPGSPGKANVEDGVVDGVPDPTPSRRRKSVITETPDHHEICWPVKTGASSPQAEKVATAPTTATSTEHAIQDDDSDDDFLCTGGSCIVSPFGEVLAGPLWKSEDGLLIVEADFEDCERGRLDLDVAGSYSRNDSFRLVVEGLDLNPPP